MKTDTVENNDISKNNMQYISLCYYTQEYILSRFTQINYPHIRKMSLLRQLSMFMYCISYSFGGSL